MKTETVPETNKVVEGEGVAQAPTADLDLVDGGAEAAMVLLDYC